MGGVRTCVYFSVVFLCLELSTGKPIFGGLWCDLFCDDDDATTTSSSNEDYYDWFGDCSSCPTQRSPTTTTQSPIPATGSPNSIPFNLMIPPSSGVNVSLANQGGSWLLGLVPWPASAGGASGAGGPTTAAPATTNVVTTVAPTAGGSTTVAATTAAA